MIEIRREQERDYSQVYQVNVAAFKGDVEARLVDKLHGVEGYLSYVADLDGRVVGHISFSAVTLDDELCPFAGLAPMSVLPEFQKQGIGSLLVNAGLKDCSKAGYTAAFVLGHAEYYPKFGFQAAEQYGIRCEYPSPAENFMVFELQTGALEGESGLIKYHPIFAEF